MKRKVSKNSLKAYKNEATQEMITTHKGAILSAIKELGQGSPTTITKYINKHFPKFRLQEIQVYRRLSDLKKDGLIEKVDDVKPKGKLNHQSLYQLVEA